jgi:hypothetical protein
VTEIIQHVEYSVQMACVAEIDQNATAHNLVPRVFALGAKTLVDAGHVTHRKLIASEGDRKVSYYMFPLPHFTLRLQGVAVLYNNL